LDDPKWESRIAGGHPPNSFPTSVVRRVTPTLWGVARLLTVPFLVERFGHFTVKFVAG
jgi:hypothetical protein